jgi:hypothetical protein
MDHGDFSVNSSINRWIIRCFEEIHQDDVPKFVKKFRSEPHHQDQVMHSFRELIFGAFLARNGSNVRYDLEIEGKTPDWSLLSTDSELTGLLDVVNLHNCKAIEDEIRSGLKHRGTAGVWSDPEQETERLFSQLYSKSLVYKNLVNCLGLPYAIGLFQTFFIALDWSQIDEVLNHEETGLFRTQPHVSGLLIGADGAGYNFHYVPNPHAMRPLELPQGPFNPFQQL